MCRGSSGQQGTNMSQSAGHSCSRLSLCTLGQVTAQICRGCSSNCLGCREVSVGSVCQVPSTRGLSLQPHPSWEVASALSLRREPPCSSGCCSRQDGVLQCGPQVPESWHRGAAAELVQGGKRPLLSAGTGGGTGSAICTRVKWCKPLHATPCLLVVSLAKAGLGWVFSSC